MRFRTAAISSVVLVGGMFATSIAGGALARWHLGRGDVEIPNYERMFFGIAAFCSSFSAPGYPDRLSPVHNCYIHEPGAATQVTRRTLLFAPPLLRLASQA
jgi:hypothetical protein